MSWKRWGSEVGNSISTRWHWTSVDVRWIACCTRSLAWEQPSRSLCRGAATRFFFYCCDKVPDAAIALGLDPAYSWRLWTPAQGGFVPNGFPLLPFGAWTAMHRFRMFSNREYGVLVVYHRDRLVHRSGLFPRYLRFPFMANDDLQVGDVWTDPEHRGRGIASFAVRQIVAAKARRGRRIWYIVEAGNASSIRIVEKLGFVRAGTGRRTRRFGLGLLGQFVMDSGHELR